MISTAAVWSLVGTTRRNVVLLGLQQYDHYGQTAFDIVAAFVYFPTYTSRHNAHQALITTHHAQPRLLVQAALVPVPLLSL
jgi:hypothetical protein